MSKNITQDQKDSSKAGVQLAGTSSPKRTYNYAQVDRLLGQKDKEGNYTIKSKEQAMELFVSTGLGTKQFIAERWEIVKLIYRCFHSTTCGMEIAVIEQYHPVESGKDILAAIEKKLKSYSK